MVDDWDVEDNSVESRAAAAQRVATLRHEDEMERWRIEREEREARRLENRRTRGYFMPPGIDDETIRENFPYLRTWLEDDRHYRRNGLTGGWLANKLYYVCHNCGCISYKCTDDISELFKCSHCRSRHINVLRAGEISMAIRNNNVGLDMREVYNERRERIRRERAERSAQRRNRQRAS